MALSHKELNCNPDWIILIIILALSFLNYKKSYSKIILKTFLDLIFQYDIAISCPIMVEVLDQICNRTQDYFQMNQPTK